LNIFNWTTVLYCTLSAGLGFREKTGYKRKIQSQEGDTRYRRRIQSQEGHTGYRRRIQSPEGDTGYRRKIQVYNRKDTELGKGNRTQS